MRKLEKKEVETFSLPNEDSLNILFNMEAHKKNLINLDCDP